MQFTDKIQQKFKEAGWRSHRDVSSKYNTTKKIDEFPQFLKDFLFEYGELTVSEVKKYESDITNKLIINPNLAEYKDDSLYAFYKTLFGKDIYPFANFEPDGYRIGCDADGKVYMLGDYYFIIGDTFQKGIENLITDNWNESFEFDEETKEWISKN